MPTPTVGRLPVADLRQEHLRQLRARVAALEAEVIAAYSRADIAEGERDYYRSARAALLVARGA